MRLVLTVAIVALIIVPSALALGRNNNGATLNISPAQPSVGDSVILFGCDYQPNFVLVVTVQADNKAGAEVFYEPVVTGPDGCFATESFTPASVGDYYAHTYFGNGHKVATLDFTVT